METINLKNNQNPADLKNDRVKMTKVANDLAKEMGANDAQDFINSTNAKLKNGNSAQKASAIKAAREFTSELLLLCLYQKIENLGEIDYIKDFADTFDDGLISNGNSKEYIATKLTGADTYQPDMFVPVKKSKKSVENHILQMYVKNADGTVSLSPKAYQFKKSLTIDEPNWLPYFKNGALGEFIAELERQMLNTYKIYKFDKIARLIIGGTYQKTIVGTAKNMFDAFSDEILPTIRNMTFLNNEFNNNATSKYIHKSNLDELLVIMSAANFQRLQSGIKSQLFNAQFLNIGSLLNEENVVCLGNQIVIGAGDTDITISSAEYVDDTTVYVISKNAIKHLKQIDRNESQSWAENMTIQLTLHIWGTMDFLPWGPCFKYTNNNLPILPTGDIPAPIVKNGVKNRV